MPHYADGPNGEQLVWMGEGKGWAPVPAPYAVAPSSDKGATTPEDADRLQQVKDTAKDVIKSGGVGLGEGVIGMAGLPADVPELAARGYDYGKRSVQEWAGKKPDEPREDQAPSLFGIPGAEGIKKKVEQYTGKFYEPQTGLGELAREAGQIAPAAAGGGGALVGIPARLASYAARTGTKIAAPMVASHAAGDFFEGSPIAPYAQIAASMLAPTGARKLVTPFIAKDAAHVAKADLLTKAGLNVSAGRRTMNPNLNDLEGKVGLADRFSPATNDALMAQALANIPGKSKAAIAARKELKTAYKDVLEGDAPKGHLDQTIHGLLTAGGGLAGWHFGDAMKGMEGLVAGHLATPVTDYAIRKLGQPTVMNQYVNKLLGNQLLGQGTHNTPQMQRALLYSTPQRLPPSPEELPPIDVNAR